jgi:small subunit ribosomal protein S5
MLKATVQGLQSLRRPEEVAATRGLTISQVLPVGAKQPEEEAPAAEASHQPAAEPEPETTDGEAEDHPDA